MPGSPSSINPAGPSAMHARKSDIARTSDSLPANPPNTINMVATNGGLRNPLTSNATGVTFP